MARMDNFIKVNSYTINPSNSLVTLTLLLYHIGHCVISEHYIQCLIIFLYLQELLALPSAVRESEVVLKFFGALNRKKETFER